VRLYLREDQLNNIMDEFTLGKKIGELKQIKPNAQWVSLAKSQIVQTTFEKNVKPSFREVAFNMFNYIKQPQLVTALASFALFTIGSVSFAAVAAKDAVPGEPLYIVKHAQESLRMATITSPQQKVIAQFERASIRLDELDKVSKQSENNQDKKLAAITEIKKAVTQATKDIASLPADEQASLIGQLANKIQTVEKNTNAAIMDDKEPSYESIYKFLADSEIKELDANAKNLTTNQKRLLSQAKGLFDVQKYSEALDVIYQIQPQPKIEETNTSDTTAK
jgi:Na+/phosphate symporter